MGTSTPTSTQRHNSGCMITAGDDCNDGFGSDDDEM